MKENEKKVSLLVGEGDQNKTSNLPDDGKSKKERFKKPLIFVLMGIVFLGCMYLIFKPSPDKKGIENIGLGLNDSVPQASDAGMQEDKQKAYEQEMLEQEEQKKRSALTTLSDYWNEDGSSDEATLTGTDEEDSGNGTGSSSRKSGNPVLNSYRNAQSTLGSFYQDDNNQTKELRKQLDELKEQLAEKEVPAGITANDQLALMEKSYQMAAKYLPSGTNTNQAPSSNSTSTVTPVATKTAYFTSFTPVRKSVVSTLYREPSDSTFLADWSETKKTSFHTAGSVPQVILPRNSIKACIQETQIIIGESMVQLRLLEPAKTPDHILDKGTLLTAASKFQGGRLQLKVTSIEVEGNIIPVDITIYDLDGQQGLNVPYSPEMNALTEMAGNMSQQSGTSLILTQSAGQQIAAEMSKGVVQGISGYFAKKVRTPKVTLKAGYQLFLVSKK
ncbi:conjugative transposon protein TraM [Flavobacterium sp. Fl-77]|uniref:Conjugative transposon protein TraM n=1 Tax=Flavobacterium flavipigmentatum TaxID=2893884 RepID=A0AAJ2S8Z7_9FLAO|nr:MULTISPECIES: conjugative transposon protein TraM [unclassified Flavobacterium]MDX6182385.1 conjugative transposon protein TraM [Flavobacterium sp. Fl-33]MDX6185702.1 conjugative transposon protein TraM [Flavobacterium sp. Fl-77]UFH38886.1 conjugative transposon protein TraM [Flavobacterium sp. F-70]